MNLVKKSKKLSWLLRHGANEAGVDMDSAGWVPVEQVLATIGMSPSALERVVAENNKSRLEVVEGRIRCSQGHSLEGTPVTREALEASWRAMRRTEPLLHGTSLAALEGIATSGIRPMRRTHVHLAGSATSRVGKRANVAVLLHVDPARIDGLWLSQNGVWLTRFVPPAALVGFEACTRRAHQQADRIAGLLRLGGHEG